ncbi:hypothetical protein DEJ45_25310 [Streptomyces venezuelae]|uniref:hypothetical protein n=1 Tax=Streptomyces venezuelae TaxID=54571 RepID=UPI00123E0325|nr:hypothetical protein [Streptomyces venezuelae]QES15369.1 hypothetical protein DEJ45_25310 [Streptomyces venezuelae]
MINTKRALATIALAGAALALTPAAQAAEPDPSGGLDARVFHLLHPYEALAGQASGFVAETGENMIG